MRRINPYSQAGTIPAGKMITFQPRGYFALLEGTGLEYTERGNENRFATLPLRTIHGDGQALPPIIIKNPTAGTVTYEIYTADIPFDPKLDGVTQTVNVVGQVETIISGASPLHALADLVDGEATFTVTGALDVLAQPGAALALRVYEVTITNRDTAAATVLLYSGAVLKRRVIVPAGQTLSVDFPAGWKLASNVALKADVLAATTTNPVYVAATAAKEA